jgi:hypothetical protein
MPINTVAAINLDPAINGTTGAAGHTPPTGGIWVASTVFSNGAIIRPTTPNGFQYINNGASGTTGASQPNWNNGFPGSAPGLTIGGTVADNGITWTTYTECALPPGTPELTVPLNGDTGVPQGIVSAFAVTDNWLADIWFFLTSKLVPNSSYAAQTSAAVSTGGTVANSGYAFVGSQPALGLGFTSGSPNYEQIAQVGSGAAGAGCGVKFTTQTFAVSFTTTIGATSASNITGINLPCTLVDYANAQVQVTMSCSNTSSSVVIQKATLTLGGNTMVVSLFNPGGATGSIAYTLYITVVGGDY